MFSQLSSFFLINTNLSGSCKEVKVPPSARRHGTQVTITAVMNPLSLHNLFMDFHIRGSPIVPKGRTRVYFSRHKNRLTKPKHLITKNAAFSSKKYNSVPQFRCF